MRKMIILLMMVLVCSVWCLSSNSKDYQFDDNSVRDRVSDAATACYVIEGKYPEDLSYLEENYGLVIPDGVNVLWNWWTPDMMPDFDIMGGGRID